uniref:NADH-ubiquinone oxidoreductase chain 5 n=1 Tax=Arbanatus sp. TaxID=2931282 RepID=A0A8T9ZYM5_9HEMI|nr:NADH dehydrogenase subunit 5 [Arbanatus sp.]
MFFVSLYMLYFVYLLFLGLLMFFTGIWFNLFSFSLFMDYEFCTINSIIISFSLYFDDISFLFMGCVLMISSMVVLYSHVYMENDLNMNRFLYLVLLFVLSMMLLIISPNMFSILLGWDGLGLISYCLVVYFNNFKSYNAGLLTVFTNRIGDVAILLSMSFMLNSGSMIFSYLSYNFVYVHFILFLVVLASFTSSAQFPFSSWLPAAMAAPTPVSALVHSSTLVTAGVYLLVRFNYVLKDIDCTLFLSLSLVTMTMAGLGAMFEYDLKSVIALSTLGQLGLMMMMIFVGDELMSFFHLLNHAFFKSLLFLCAGLIIHCIGDTQDIRDLGCSLSFLPVTMGCFCISSLSLCGVPFLTGFYSKHMLFDLLLSNSLSWAMVLMFLVSMVTTIMYSTRLIYYCFVGRLGCFYSNCYYEDGFMTGAMLFLAFMSISGGSILHWFLLVDFTSISYIDTSYFGLVLMVLVFILGIFISKFNYNFKNYLFSGSFMGSMWFLPSFSIYLLYYSLIYMSLGANKYYGTGWSELVTAGKFIYFMSVVSFVEKLLFNNNFSVIMMLMLIFFFVAFF